MKTLKVKSTFYLKTFLGLIIMSSLLSLKVINKQETAIEGRVLTNKSGLVGASISIYNNKTLVASTTSGALGYYKLDSLKEGIYTLVITKYGYEKKTLKSLKINSGETLAYTINIKKEHQKERKVKSKISYNNTLSCPSFDSESSRSYSSGRHSRAITQREPDIYLNNTESYAKIQENKFFETQNEKTSTFSIDVDKASYSNIRRYINQGFYPKKDAVRVEEMINYFNYDYKAPNNGDPFSIHTSVAPSPWNNKTHIMKIGIKGSEVPLSQNKKLPPSNLVFLIDVSGSMRQTNKLPLLKKSFNKLIDQLRPEDKVAIVVYAGAAGEVLPPTSGSKKNIIKNAINRLNAGGSTAGGAGIRLAYKLAEKNFVKGGNNRVILSTDGDFNVGISNISGLEALIVKKRKTGVFLTTIGFGTGNYKDDRMEMLSNKGNGNYFYIDNLSEANKVFVEEFAGTMFAIAKDVKVQIDFNDQYVKRYRLIGYENRMLSKKDFNDDKKDAGELGMGHTVTALYELEFYNAPTANDKNFSEIKLRYKKPDEEVSKLIKHPINHIYKSFEETNKDFKLSSSVAAFGMKLRNSKFIDGFSYNDIIALAKKSQKTGDKYRSELLSLIEKTRILDPSFATTSK